MATTPSSATSPSVSPPMNYMQPIPPILPASQAPSTSTVSSSSHSTDTVERERRKKAVQKFLARAELSNVTRTLRSRLSYATYKTINQSSSTSFADFEAQSQGLGPNLPAARSYAAKRKAPSQPAGNSNANRGSVGPSPRTPTVNGSFGASTSTAATNPEPNNTHSLFTSILAPPPTSQARTILNVNDPPVPPPVRPPVSPKTQFINYNGKAVRSIAESTRAHTKGRRQPDKRKDKDKGKNRKGVDADGDVDMEAAATLTSLLLNHRPSIAGSASSPRSSVDGSEPGTSFPQPTRSARSSLTSGASGAVPATASTSYNRSNTPPRSSKTPVQQHHPLSPRPAPTDNEAADLMLFLATSPSPARASTSKNARDAAAFRALGNPASNPNNTNNGNMMRAKPRVLFPTQGEPNDDPSPGPSGRRASRTSSGLARNDSFAGSSMSSIGGEMDTRTSSSSHDRNMSAQQHQFSHQQTQPPLGTQGNVAHLLPPPSLPAHHQSSTNYPSGPSSHRQEEIYSEYPPQSRSGTGQPPASKAMGLREDVGRKLFEEEQMRQQMRMQRRPDDRSLEAGVDLVRT